MRAGTVSRGCLVPVELCWPGRALPRSRCSSRWFSLLPSIASLNPQGRVSAAETQESQHVYQSLQCGGSKMASEKSSSFRIRSEQGSAHCPGAKEKAPLSWVPWRQRRPAPTAPRCHPSCQEPGPVVRGELVVARGRPSSTGRPARRPSIAPSLEEALSPTGV